MNKSDVKRDTVTVYLSRRNLLALLSKLDRVKAGEQSACTLIKYFIEEDDFQQSHDEIHIIAIEDQLAYKNRNPGQILSVDDPNLKGKSGRIKIV